MGIRQLPGVCWYPVKCTAVVVVNQGGTADKCLFVLDRVYISVKDVFFFQDSFDSNKSRESIPIKEVKHHVVDETMAKLDGFCS